MPISRNHLIEATLLVQASPASGPVHEQVGYKEGLEEGKANTLQQGFDEGKKHRWLLCHHRSSRCHTNAQCCAS